MPTILLVADDPLVVRVVTRAAHRQCRVVHITRKRRALDALRSRTDIALLLTDLVVEEEPSAGFEILDATLSRRASLPATLMAGLPNQAIVNRATRLGATVLWKPFGPNDVAAVVAPFHKARASRRAVLCELADRRALQWRLSPSETALLLHLLHDGSAESFAKARGVELSTVRTFTRRLLQKSGHTRTAAIVSQLLCEALDRSDLVVGARPDPS